jgi:predicted transcriptional regulator
MEVYPEATSFCDTFTHKRFYPEIPIPIGDIIMPTLIELTSKIVAQHAAKTVMTQEQLLQDMHLVHAALQRIEQDTCPELSPAEPVAPVLTLKQAFRKNEVICMLCNKGGFKTLSRHLSSVHNLKPGQYRKQFNIPGTQKLAAKSFSEAMAKAAVGRGQGEILAKARASRMVKNDSSKNAPVVKSKAATPAKKDKAAVPAVKEKASVPANRVKAAVPVVTVKETVSDKKKKGPV